jgi:hypothetical protein
LTIAFATQLAPTLCSGRVFKVTKDGIIIRANSL